MGYFLASNDVVTKHDELVVAHHDAIGNLHGLVAVARVLNGANDGSSAARI
ncbi:MAG: hypothetical protein HKN03_14895 [Acidimicrobiales bacterium]|nr:hypothetical protein [Acidimicrobiales bacterium]